MKTLIESTSPKLNLKKETVLNFGKKANNSKGGGEFTSRVCQFM